MNPREDEIIVEIIGGKAVFVRVGGRGAAEDDCQG